VDVLDLGTLSSDSSCQLNVLVHDGHSLGVNGAKVRVLKETNEVGLRGFLEGSNGRRLESQISLVVLSDFTDESLEGQLSDQELSRLLVLSDLSESDGTGLESVGLLHTSSLDGGLSGGLVGDVFARCLSSC